MTAAAHGMRACATVSRGGRALTRCRGRAGRAGRAARATARASSATSCSEVVSDAARDVFMGHSWPGNVRELKGACQGLAYLAAEDEISPDDVAGVLA